MRKYSIIFVYLFFFLAFLNQRLGAQEWKELNGDHFLVYYLGDESFAKDVSKSAEVYYERIASELGYPRYSEFWTWDKRVKVYIWPNHQSFLKATGQPKWSQGMADYQKKQIISYAWSKDFSDSLLPHEMAHLIFRDFVGFKGEIPLWLDEGVAQWAEEPKRKQIKAMARQYYLNDQLLSLSDLMKLDIRNVSETDKVYIRSTRTKDGDKGVLFLSGNHLVQTFYLEAVSLVGFLIEKYGSYAFSDFCRRLRDGKNIEDALKFAYPSHMRSLEDFETKWREYLESEV